MSRAVLVRLGLRFRYIIVVSAGLPTQRAMANCDIPAWLFDGIGAFERSAQEGHHRWSLPKGARWEAKHGGWNLQIPDMLPHFLATLPEPLDTVIEQIQNKHGQSAEIHKLIYARAEKEKVVQENLWHGTWFKAVGPILRNGFRDSSDVKVHEFTTAGTYCARNVDASLHTYAVPTKMVNGEAPWNVPYCRFIFLVEALGEPIKVKSFGGDVQVIHHGKDLRVLELHVYRGWHIYDTSEYVMQLSADENTAIQNVAEARKQSRSDDKQNKPTQSDELCSVIAQDSQTTIASSTSATSMSRVSTDITCTSAISTQSNNVSHCSSQSSTGAVEWMPGEPWHWNVCLRCYFCQSVRPVQEFRKKSQAYACQQRRCRDC